MIEDGLRIDKYGTKQWYQDGLLHRLDGPAVVYPNGTRFWYQDGELHRLDEPAMIWANGTKLWYKHGQLHRVDGPSIEYADGDKEWWYEDNKLVITSEFIRELLEVVVGC